MVFIFFFTCFFFFFFKSFAQKHKCHFLCRPFGLQCQSRALLCWYTWGLHVGPRANCGKRGRWASVCKWTYQQSVLSKSIVSQLLPQVPLCCQGFYIHDSYKKMRSFPPPQPPLFSLTGIWRTSPAGWINIQWVSLLDAGPRSHTTQQWEF